MKNIKSILLKIVICYVGYSVVSFISNDKIFAQQVSSKNLGDSIKDTRISTLSESKKLAKFYYLKKIFENNNLANDSVYALILHLIGFYEHRVNKNYNRAINFTLLSLKINTSKGKNCSLQFATNSYFNIAFYYEVINSYSNSLKYYDSVIIHLNSLKKESSNINVILRTGLEKAFIYFRQGDYQKSVEESTKGINEAIFIRDSTFYLKFLNQRSQAFFHQEQFKQSLADVYISINLAEKVNDPYQLANAYRMKAIVNAAKSDFKVTIISFKKTIEQRLITEDNGQIAEDYNDFANFFADSLKDTKQAKSNYLKGIEYANKINDSLRLARINGNLGNTFFQEKNFVNAQIFYTKAFNYLKLNTPNFFSNPTCTKTNLIGDKELLIFLFKSKTELLLNQFLQNNNKTYLEACLKTALFTDSVINETRHEQLGEQSKLYWRNNTRDFYSNALEACNLANNPSRAFFFMEKSRAVLLNDKLNELGALAHLPPIEAEKEDNLRSNIVQQEQQLAVLKEGTEAYKTQQMNLLTAKNNFDDYIHSLEQKFPIYYQYKYNDSVPDLKELQQSLAKNNQAFVHYFITDSLIYILGITPNNTKLKRVPKADFNVAQLSDFLIMCADADAPLKDNYPTFVKLSNSIYSALFKPLQIQQNRVVICADNFLIPFGALCTDNTGKHFLIQNHAFSYAYSARSLLKPFNNPSPKGDLLGMAPVSFAPYLKLPKLKESANSLKTCSKAFNNVQLLLGNDATKDSFIKLLSNYSVVNVFSHASVDSSGDEPLLFMADSAIHLSELQKIKSPATQLVVLSACQTNVGKLATGEGIYSLARGFASSGIPSVAATLWEADEDAIYEITQLFDQNLAKGMRKDDALQQAELAFMQHGGERGHPFFWANMVLVGSAEPVVLSGPNHWGLIVSIAGVVLLIVAVIVFKRRKVKD